MPSSIFNFCQTIRSTTHKPPTPRISKTMKITYLLTLLTTILSIGCTSTTTQKNNNNSKLIFLEAESFDNHGGWMLDQQFMDLMGSPYLLAHGMGKPVNDASTTQTFNAGGKYRVWVRTQDWVAKFNAKGAPGKFQITIDNKIIPTTFGTKGALWDWQDGGIIQIPAGKRNIKIHDLTGFEGRCDAIIFTQNLEFKPTNDDIKLREFRRIAKGLPLTPTTIQKKYDLVIIGGGTAGTAAAVTAARLGLQVALIQDRPVLGGNASSEVRVWPEGHTNKLPYPRVGDVTNELMPKHPGINATKNARDSYVYDDNKKMKIVNAEPNITLYMEHRANGVTTNKNNLATIVAESTRNGKKIRIKGKYFLDSTGDASIGYLAGADYQITDKEHMGASNLWNIKCLCKDEDLLSQELKKAVEKEAKFPRTPWAVDLEDKPFPGRTSGAKIVKIDKNGPIPIGNWFWETGFDLDSINQVERMRDQNFRAMYGAWDTIKNVEKRYVGHALNWVAFIAGKRESRRLMGDVLVSADDFRNLKKFDDAAYPCSWGLDTHFPHPKYDKGHEQPFIAEYTHGKKYNYGGLYWAPYRTLYSRNINNLFMAGRNISVTHGGLGAVRVMRTTSMMGEIVGMAASICKKHNCTPREVYTKHLDELKQLLKTGAGKKSIAKK